MTRLLIYLSFLSIPGADELGLLQLTAVYVALVLAMPIVSVAMKPASPLFANGVGAPKAFKYLLLLLLFLPLNYTVANLNQVDSMTWLSRSVHLALVPAFYFSFKFARLDPKTVFQDISIVGFIEAILIYVAFFTYLDSSELRRAADLEGVIVYSVFLLFAAFFCLRKYEAEGRRSYLLMYFLILFATVLTGTRVLMISTALLLFVLQNKVRTFIMCAVFAAAIVPLVTLGLFVRFNVAEEENLITISSKIEELQLLWRLFTGNPTVGAGFGKAYQVSLAATEYTYSHNMIFFYLGYAGLVGALIALYPLIRLAMLSQYRAFVISIIFFYTSSTTYTNVKHSILLAFALLVLDYRRPLKRRHSYRPVVAQETAT